MRPVWRLAIKSVFERPSRSLLLVATVALSACLITAVSSAMHSMQESARRQLVQLAGAGDVRVQPTAVGKGLPEGLLETARAWPGVLDAVGEHKAAVRVLVRLTGLEASEDGFVRRERRVARNVAVSGFSAFRADQLSLLAGRLPQAPGEAVIDGTLAATMTWQGSKATSPTELPSREDGLRRALEGQHPDVPERADAGVAATINARVGVRVGDVLEVARGALPEVNIAAVLSDPARAAEMAKAAGVKPTLGDLSALLRAPGKVTIVGISSPPPFGGRPKMVMTTPGLAELMGTPGNLGQVSLTLARGVDPEAFVREHRKDMPEGVTLVTTAKVTSGLDRNVEASRLGFLLATTMAFLCAGFIITTAMTTGVTEKQRELGILRCLGADKAQLAQGQVLVGLMIGLAGALAGMPLGALLAAALVRYLQSQIEIRLALPAWGLLMAGGGALLCGLLGAAWPAWRATRVSPLEALASRAVEPQRGGVYRLLIAGLVLLAVQISVVTLVQDGQWRFWLYVFVGLPALFFGYFALSVPVLGWIARSMVGVVATSLRVPRHVVARSMASTPYRFGFTAGSMMMGLALMVGIWTQGGAVQRDWLGKLQFPDAFITGLNLTEESQRRLDALPYVQSTVAITIHSVETKDFGVRALQTYRSTFLAFEPEKFFAMVKPVWVQGDEATAVRRLREGGAVIIGREFHVAQGLGVGDTFVCTDQGKEHRFEIVGVVTSPGLEVISQFFSVGEDYSEQSLHAVFGSRQDLKTHFGSDAVHLLQIQFKPGTDDTVAVRDIREQLAGAGILDAGSGRKVKEEIESFVGTALLAVSSIAVVSMVVAGFGVANLIVAGIRARAFEFGVLRALGAGRGQVVRLVLAEVVLIGLGAAALGTLMGLQGVFAIQRIDERLFGLTLHVRPPVAPILIGWGFTLAMTVGAALPALASLWRQSPRKLLAAVRG